MRLNIVRASWISGEAGAARGGPIAKAKIMPKIHATTSLVLRAKTTHLHLGFNAAKGGDPMSHGSAGRSERGVRAA